MPTDYEWSACKLRVSTGSYHGGSHDGNWYNALYCRHCGAKHQLAQNGKQFFDGFGKTSELTTLEYTIHGPTATQEVVITREMTEPPAVTCEACGASGPFGNSGPLTDDPPEGIFDGMPDLMRKFPEVMARQFTGMGSGTCPRCKGKTMTVASWWTT